MPLGVAAFTFGVSFGVLARGAGFDGLSATVMSATTWAGSAQFASASVLEAGGGAAAAIIAAVLLNARYGAMSLALAPSLRGSPVRRAATSLGLADETWALAAHGDGRFDPGRMVGAALVMWVGWVAGTALGSLGGDFLGDPKSLGLDAAFPALFLALLVPQLRSRPALAAAAGGSIVALVLLPVAPAGVPIIAAAAVALLGLKRPR